MNMDDLVDRFIAEGLAVNTGNRILEADVLPVFSSNQDDFKIQVIVDELVPNTLLPPDEIIPSSFEGVPVEVVAADETFERPSPRDTNGRVDCLPESGPKFELVPASNMELGHGQESQTRRDHSEIARG